VEIEINGYLSYDREVEKMDFERVREMHARLGEKTRNKKPKRN
jgi:hypothetical protein